MKARAGVAIGLMALSAGAGLALAATEHVATGSIERLNAQKRQLVINHRTYHYNDKIATSGLQQGARVKVFYHQNGRHRSVYKIEPMGS